jgi:molecular chaperone GrpE
MTDEVNAEVKSDTQAETSNEQAGETAAQANAGGAVPADLQAQLTKAQAEAQINLTGWQRERADFANYKRRIEKELKESRDRGALDAITRMLPVVDDFERALQNIPADLKDHPWVSGTALILKKFDKVLDEFAVEIIDPVGQPFDPHRHEAIGTDASTAEIASGHVTVTLQKGYASGDRVLRPALVRVAG